jgi:dTDP-4-dehydrorhamnose reductase
MNPRILLAGSRGQVGRGLARLLPALGEVTAPDRQQLNLTKPEQIRGVIRTLRPELIVNAAAYTDVDRAESEVAVAKVVNCDAPRVMAEEALKVGAVLVHYSTDYVFDGKKGTPYMEDDPTGPLNAYGRTKLAGEQAIVQSGVPHLILRTAWVYDRSGRNFMRTILRLATHREELRIVQDQIGAPTWSQEISRATVQILQKLCAQGSLREAFIGSGGIYHLTARGEVSWCGFAKTILEEASSHLLTSSWLIFATEGRPLITRRITPITTTEYPTPARRPQYSVLSNARLAQVFGVRLPDWRTQLHSVFTDDRVQAG